MLGRISLTICALFGCVLASVTLKHLGQTETSIDTSYVFKQQPLNRRLLNDYMTEQASDATGSGTVFEVAKILHMRDKRNDLARFYTSIDLAKQENSAVFLDSYLPLFSTSDYSQQLVYADAFAQITVADAIFQDLKLRLKAKPSWGVVVLRAIMESENRKPEDLYSLVELYPRFHKAFLDYYIRTKRPNIAYEAFLQFTDLNGKPLNVPYNPELKQWPGPAPFNWLVNPKTSRFLEYGGINVAYFGSEIQTAFSQVIKLTADEYNLETTLSGTGGLESGHFEWQVRCLDTNTVLLKHKIEKLSYSREQTVLEFTVPDTQCEFQRLSLRGYPGNFSQTITADVYKVNIVPKGSTQIGVKSP